jgi:hypothetical protein
MHGIHNIFPAQVNGDNDPISFKKVKKGDSSWMQVKDILGFTLHGEAKTLWLEAQKQDALLDTLHQWLQVSGAKRAGIPFKQFELVLRRCNTPTLRYQWVKGYCPRATMSFANVRRTSISIKISHCLQPSVRFALSYTS